MNKIGVTIENLKARRISALLTQSKLAASALVSVSLICKAEKGERIAKINRIKIINTLLRFELQRMNEDLAFLKAEIEANEKSKSELNQKLQSLEEHIKYKQQEILLFQEEN